GDVCIGLLPFVVLGHGAAGHRRGAYATATPNKTYRSAKRVQDSGDRGSTGSMNPLFSYGVATYVAYRPRLRRRSRATHPPVQPAPGCGMTLPRCVPTRGQGSR